jgi:hypothetical protein
LLLRPRKFGHGVVVKHGKPLRRGKLIRPGGFNGGDVVQHDDVHRWHYGIDDGV